MSLPTAGAAQAATSLNLRTLPPDAVSAVRQSLSSTFQTLLSRTLGPTLMSHLPPPLPLTRYNTTTNVGKKRHRPLDMVDSERQKKAKGLQGAKA